MSGLSLVGQSARHILTLALAAFGVCFSSGCCSSCCAPFDYCGPVLDGGPCGCANGWCDRSGSILAPSGYTAANMSEGTIVEGPAPSVAQGKTVIVPGAKHPHDMAQTSTPRMARLVPSK